MKTKRQWTNPAGYRELAVWSNARLLEILIRRFTSTLAPTHEFRLKAQADDCARSTCANIEEGFKRPTTKEYLDFLGFSQGSLEEVKGDVNRSLHNGLIKSIPGSSLSSLGINLKDWNDWCKDEKNEVRLLEFKLRQAPNQPLSALNPNALSYEIFIELINKTDYLMRALVASLQKSGDYNEELKKDPHAAEEKEFDNWLKKEMESQGYHQLENGQWEK